MYDYDIPERTVTLTFDEYRDLVTRTHSAADADLSFNDLDVFAFTLMEDEDRSDYELSVAMEWLHYRCKPIEKVGEWCAIMRDLEYQLKRIYKTFKEGD